jgi:hypothetical protein
MLNGLREGRTPHPLIDTQFLTASTELSDVVQALAAYSYDRHYWLRPACIYVDVDAFTDSGSWNGCSHPAFEIYNTFPRYEMFVHQRLLAIDALSTDTMVSSASAVRGLFFSIRKVGQRRDIVMHSSPELSVFPHRGDDDALIIAPGLFVALADGYFSLVEPGLLLRTPAIKTAEGWFYCAPPLSALIEAEALVIFTGILFSETLLKLSRFSGDVVVSPPNEESMMAVRLWLRNRGASNIRVLSPGQIYRVRAKNVFNENHVFSEVLDGHDVGSQQRTAAGLVLTVFGAEQWDELQENMVFTETVSSGGRLVPIHKNSFDMWLSSLGMADRVRVTRKYLQVVVLLAPRARIELLDGKGITRR